MHLRGWASFYRYFNKRLFFILCLSFASGLPLLLLGSTLQAWYTVSGIDLATIGMLSLVGQPYAYKFLWAPCIDRVSVSFLGRRRGWVLITQACIAVGLVMMAFLSPNREPSLLACLALCVAFFSASQDIAIDAYRVDLLHVAERGPGVAVMTIGYRIAMLVGGGLALLLAAHMGWKGTYLMMAACIMMAMIATIYAPACDYQENQPATWRAACSDPFRDILKRKHVLIIFMFIILYKLPDALAFALNTTFLIRNIGFTLVELGVMYKLVALSATILGGIAAGAVLPLIGLFRALMIFGLLQALSNLCYMSLALMEKNYICAVLAIFCEYFCSGLSMLALVVFVMKLCNHKYSATQYAFFSALTALGRVFAGPIVPVLVHHWGWAQFYLFTAMLGAPALFLLWWLRYRFNFQSSEIPSLESA